MQSRIGVRRVMNRQEAWYCELVLRRVTDFPAEIRLYIRKFLCDQVCLLDKPFHGLGITWSPLQLDVYRSMLTGPRINEIRIPKLHGATTVIVGMALSLALLGFKTVIIVKDVNYIRGCMGKVTTEYIRHYSSQASMRIQDHLQTVFTANGGSLRCLPNDPFVWYKPELRYSHIDIIFTDNVYIGSVVETCPTQLHLLQIVSTPQPAPNPGLISY
jgi:hypothetical protein